MARVVKPLTNAEIDRSKPKEKQYTLSDGDGLYLLIKPNGSKIWRFQYYKPFTKKRGLISLGNYPSITLAKAREIRQEFRTLIAQNIDPLDYREKQKIEAIQCVTTSFKTVAEQWFRLKRNEVDTFSLNYSIH